MPDAEPQTPFAEAVQMLHTGRSETDVRQHLTRRGLDAQDVDLLLTAAKARAPGAAQPQTEWAEPAPVARAEPAAAAAVATAPPKELPPCARCGSFVTPTTYKEFMGKVYCLACADRPDVNYLKAWKDARWGKRDGWAWFYGVVALLAALGAAASAMSGRIIDAGVGLLGALAYGLFWSGWPPARLAIIAAAVVSVASSLVGGFGGGGIVGLIFAISAVQSARNKLFFELEVSEAELQKAWQAENDNRVALWSRGVSLVALLSMVAWLGIWQLLFLTIGLGVLAAVLGAIGFSRVDAAKTPPIGQKGAALFGVIAGGISVACAVAFYFLRTRP